MRAAVAISILLAACGFDPSGGGGGGGGDRSDGGGGPGDDGGGSDPFDGGGAGPDGTPLDAAVEATARVSCAATVEPPVIDAAPLGPWVGMPLLPFAVTDAQLVADEHAMYEDDAVVELACLHDEFNIYFFFKVTDGDVQDDSTAARDDDSVVIFLDGADDRAGTYGEDDHAAAVTSVGDGADYNAHDNDLTGDADGELIDGGYRVEVEIDKPSIHDALGDELGFNLAIIDDDGWGDDLRDIFALRHVPDDQEANACTSCCEGQAAPWCDTRMFGTLILE